MTEEQRLAEIKSNGIRWKLWGPYLSERQWGTVREDYSEYGTAWDYFTHDMARSRAYRWGEDGIAGISDDRQLLCFSVAFWNEKDPILKERLFGLTNSEGNHGEDVKELYYYLDATPTHSYLKALYKYPQRAYPYAELVAESRRRGRHDPEYELIDTGVLAENRYFDIFVEYAKIGPDDILILITAHNRGPEEAPLHVLPQLWFRNTWSWGYPSPKPCLALSNEEQANRRLIVTHHAEMHDYHLYAEGNPDAIFCDNISNPRRLWQLMDAEGYFKDAFHERVVEGNYHSINPDATGTRAAAHYSVHVPAAGSNGSTVQFRLRLSADPQGDPFATFDQVFADRRHEADEFYGELQKEIANPDERMVQRQAMAGMIWGKQSYHFDVRDWLHGDPAGPPPPLSHRHGRNHDWKHLNNSEVLSMPDKWEYPWFAAWDLAFHTVTLALVDAEFAKRQLVLLTREWYMHPNGQLPAYEWAFGDVNPPVHGWATWRVFQIDRKARQKKNPQDPGDLAFLERVFHKLMLNFTWWVNRKDLNGRNIFQGGFLGLDNIGVFDRGAPLPTGGYINQSDGTSWMAMYSLNLMRIALELAQHNHVYEDIATKFFEHFLSIAEAMTHIGSHDIGLWDEEDGFFYDVLHLPSGQTIPMRVRSMVGLIPLFAVETLEPEMLNQLPGFTARLEWYLRFRPDLSALVSRWQDPGAGERRLLSLLRGSRMKKLLKRMLDETEFLSDHGVRALSRYHKDHPYTLTWSEGSGTHSMSVSYEPGESETGSFGGNSNWRGPVWMPMNFLLIESLQKFHYYYGDDFKIECPTGSGKYLTINEVACELARRLTGLFLRNEDGLRPFQGSNPVLQNDPHFRDLILFYEYFHGDNGSGLGASHQTGWTGLVGKLLQPRASA
jgi:hypothetical protein